MLRPLAFAIPSSLLVAMISFDFKGPIMTQPRLWALSLCSLSKRLIRRQKLVCRPYIAENADLDNFWTGRNYGKLCKEIN